MNKMEKSRKRKKHLKPKYIDLHHHIIPPCYVSKLNSIGIEGATAMKFPKWTPEKSLRLMDKKGIALSILSHSTPGIYYKDADFIRELARESNEYLADLIRRYPDRFGGFAILPLYDMDSTLKELEYALDTLKLDGVVLLTQIEGKYIGCPDSQELFAELNRRKAVVFIHPHDLPGDYGVYEILWPIYERLVDTVRAMSYLLTTGTLKRNPDIRYILSHGGGSLPTLASRFALSEYEEAYQLQYDRGLFDYSKCDYQRMDEALEILKTQFYYDVAQQGDPLMKSLEEIAGVSHIVFGTDAPWQKDIQVGMTLSAFENYDGLGEKDKDKIRWQNAITLFPRFKNVCQNNS